jgi:tetratricopeptide (TPR) repeat protein
MLLCPIDDVMWHDNSPRLAVAMLLLVGLAGGCANKGGKYGGGANDPLHGDPSKFDVAKEPAISADTRYAAGQLAESAGKIEQAIQQYQEAVKADPKHEHSLYRLGLLYTQKRDFTNALNTWKQYVEATGRTANAYSNLAYCFDLAGRTPEAEAAYKYGIKIDPKNRACHVNYGMMLARMGRVPEATQELSAVLKPSDVHFNLGAAHEQMGRTEDAKAEYQKSIEADPENHDAQSRLSTIE